MLRTILSVSGKPGLYKLISQGKNMLILETLDATKKRIPAYGHDKVISLGDISIYTDEGDVPLWEVLESVKVKSNGEQVDIKSIGNDAAVREYFAGILPNFDREKVYTSDIRKLLTWYNQLLAGGITEFKPEEASEENAEPEA